MSAPVQPVVHTPGPWKTWPALSLSDCADHIRICAGIESVAKVGSVDHSWPQTAADARLIAAAPDLLAALRELIFLKDVRPQDYEARKPIAWQAAREAIAKATGEVV